MIFLPLFLTLIESNLISSIQPFAHPYRNRTLNKTSNSIATNPNRSIQLHRHRHRQRTATMMWQTSDWSELLSPHIFLSHFPFSLISRFILFLNLNSIHHSWCSSYSYTFQSTAFGPIRLQFDKKNKCFQLLVALMSEFHQLRGVFFKYNWSKQKWCILQPAIQSYQNWTIVDLSCCVSKKM